MLSGYIVAPDRLFAFPCFNFLLSLNKPMVNYNKYIQMRRFNWASVGNIHWGAPSEPAGSLEGKAEEIGLNSLVAFGRVVVFLV